ncbi:MAG: NAD(P)/FAD-dependent oxidoreductase [Myxococcota bacterium]
MMDVVVIGGGLAGSTCATLLAKAGRAVTVVEPAEFPRDKLCGEFLSPEAALTLRRLGVLNPLLTLRPPRLSHGWFTHPGRACARVPLPASGLGVSRWTLDECLHRAAVRAGVQWVKGEAQDVQRYTNGNRERVEVHVATQDGRQKIQAAIGIGAYGRHGRLDRVLGRKRSPKRYVGLKRHHIGCPEDGARGSVEIHLFDGGYCGVNAVEGDRVNVCALVERRWLSACGQKDWFGVKKSLMASNPFLAERLDAHEADPDRSFLTVAGIDFARMDPVLGPLLMVGDGASMIAPLVGDGQAMALRAAEALTELILENRSDLAEAWAQRYAHAYRGRLRFARQLQTALLHPWTSQWVVRTSGMVPALPAWLARQTRETITHREPHPFELEGTHR